jgi:hypothetical protein
MAQKPYAGGCHCGRVRYEVTTELTNVIACNCSICTKRGALCVGAFSRGKDPDGRDSVAINVRCLDDLDVGTLNVMPFEGKNL